METCKFVIFNSLNMDYINLVTERVRVGLVWHRLREKIGLRGHELCWRGELSRSQVKNDVFFRREIC
jgi:hypothetical protein